MKTKSIFDSRYIKLIDGLVGTRHAKGWSQRKMAERLGTNHNSVARIEMRERRLDLVETIDYLRALGLSKAEIIEKIGELV